MQDDMTLDEWLEAQTEAINDQYEDDEYEPVVLTDLSVLHSYYQQGKGQW